MTSTTDLTEPLSVLITKDAANLLQAEKLRRGASRGDKSRIVDEALKAYLGKKDVKSLSPLIGTADYSKPEEEAK